MSRLRLIEVLLFGLGLAIAFALLTSDPANADPPANSGLSADVTCQNGVVSPVSCGGDGQTAVAVEAKGNTSNKVYFGYSGMTANNYTTAGFERCNGCAAGVNYSVDVIPGKLKCVGGGATADAGIVIAVQCLKN